MLPLHFHVCRAFTITCLSISSFPGFSITFMLPSKISVMCGYIQEAYTPRCRPMTGAVLLRPLLHHLPTHSQSLQEARVGLRWAPRCVSWLSILQLTLAHEPPFCGDGGRRRWWWRSEGNKSANEHRGLHLDGSQVRRRLFQKRMIRREEKDLFLLGASQIAFVA